MHDSLEAMLDDLEKAAETSDPLPPDPTPLQTASTAFDLVAGGGLHRGEVMIVEAPLMTQAFALLCTVARRIWHCTIFDVLSEAHATRALVAGWGQVPEILIRKGDLSEKDWEWLTISCGCMASRPVFLACAESINQLSREAERRYASIVLVSRLERFGHPAVVIPQLTAMACDRNVAVVATTPPMGELPEAIIHRTRRIAMEPFQLGSRATLIRPDDDDVLSVVQVNVNLLLSRMVLRNNQT